MGEEENQQPFRRGSLELDAPAWVQLNTEAVQTWPWFKEAQPQGAELVALWDPCEPEDLFGLVWGGLKTLISFLEEEASGGAG